MDDLLQPFLLGRPEPLTDTVPPQQLGDADSQWIEVRVLGYCTSRFLQWTAS